MWSGASARAPGMVGSARDGAGGTRKEALGPEARTHCTRCHRVGSFTGPKLGKIASALTRGPSEVRPRPTRLRYGSPPLGATYTETGLSEPDPFCLPISSWNRSL